MTELLSVDTMQPSVRQSTPDKGHTATDGTGGFKYQLLAELHSTHPQTANATNVAVKPPVFIKVEQSNRTHGMTSGDTSGNVRNGATAAGNPLDRAPLYERLYGSIAPVRAGTIEHSLSTATDSVSTRNIREFADSIRTPASIAALELGTSTNTIIAFAGLETGWGQHIPASQGLNSHNLFGIKSHNNDIPSVTNQTTEFINGEARSLAQEFRRYQSVEESIADFSSFLRSNPRYGNALSHADNPKRFIQLIHEAGYATDPDYANKVISALEQLDKITKKIGAIGIGWK